MPRREPISKFTCYRCAHSVSRVTNGRAAKPMPAKDEAYRRTRVCLNCGFTFQTDEKIVVESLGRQ